MKWYLLIPLVVVELLGVKGCLLEPSENNISNGDNFELKPPPEAGESSYSNIKLKPARLLSRDMSSALDLPENELCLEIDGNDCFKDTHLLNLRGVSAYRGSVYSPKEISARSAISLERIALISCRNRIDRDQLDLAQSILLMSDKDKMVENAFRRILARDPSPEEIKQYATLRTRVQQESKNPGRDWGVLLCYSLMSSAEFLFY